ncbi:MAG: hypothetical protein ACR2IK_21050 [Chloroflexota bacterium]
MQWRTLGNKNLEVSALGLGFLFRSQKSHGEPISYGHCWRLIRQYSIAPDVFVSGRDGELRPATVATFATARRSARCARAYRLGEVQQQLGHAQIDTTTIYTKLAARERLAVHAGVEW